jgi:cell wall-associated NlpC family hydrolase
LIGGDEGGIQLPFGALLFEEDELLEGDCVELSHASEYFPRYGVSVVNSAMEWFDGTPYQWGGVSPWGADCSGFVQRVFRAHGVMLPRDSAAQAQAGKASTSTLDDAEPGELLFFSEREDGRITHVGLAMGWGSMCHVSLMRGGFFVESFSESDDGEVCALLRQRFRGARVFVDAEAAR